MTSSEDGYCWTFLDGNQSFGANTKTFKRVLHRFSITFLQHCQTQYGQFKRNISKWMQPTLPTMQSDCLQLGQRFRCVVLVVASDIILTTNSYLFIFECDWNLKLNKLNRLPHSAHFNERKEEPSLNPLQDFSKNSLVVLYFSIWRSLAWSDLLFVFTASLNEMEQRQK